jgi:hypothetical protein
VARACDAVRATCAFVVNTGNTGRWRKAGEEGRRGRQARKAGEEGRQQFTVEIDRQG